MAKENLWDEKWKDLVSTDDSVLDRCSQQCFEIIRNLSGKNPQYLLEAGCGSGRFCIALAKEYENSRIIALDLSDSALEFVKKTAKKNGLENIICVKGDIRNLPFKNDSFDVVFNEGVIEHFHDYEKITREMARTVKKAGKVITAVPNWHNYVYNLTLLFSQKERLKYGFIKLFKHKALKNLFCKIGLEDIKCSGIDPAHAVTRLSCYWPKFEWLGRKIDAFMVRPLDSLSGKRFSLKFGFEIIICGTKNNDIDSEEGINRLWIERGRSKPHYAAFQLAAACEEIALYEKFVDFRGKNVLDIGCGLGGKAVCYAKRFCDMFAVDNKLEDLLFAKEFASSREANIKFAQADIESLPFKDEYFDVIILNDIIEHLPQPAKALGECKRILNDNGTIFINFPPFYGPGGGHLGYYFSFPWVHLLPKKIAGWLLLRKEPKQGWIAPQVVLEVFKSTNKMTIKRFKKLINSAGLSPQYCEIRPFKPLFFKKIINCPVLNEFIAQNLRCVLKKI